ncbi:MAG TPA: SDR family oxidoreductase [Mycobacteriales bacterium]|nr:SDR family oxidoreductase [Mycobacteriales bacterium]
MADGVVVITGGAGAMGIACARKLSDADAVVLVDVRAADLAAAARELKATGAPVHTLVCDVTSQADVDELAATIRSLGPFRSLVHTAGISPTMASGRQVLDVDLVGTARVIAALDPLVGVGSAAVCIGSIAGYSDAGLAADALLDEPLARTFLDDVDRALGGEIDPDTGYVLAKRGVMRLCERLSLDWGRRGGRLVSISPGLIDTPMGRHELEHQEIMKLMIDFTPVKRAGAGPLPGQAADIANAAAFLCSSAAGFISGCDLRVDGGLVGAGRHLASGPELMRG